MCTPHSTLNVPGGMLYTDYKDWAAARGDKPMSSAMFGRRVAKLAGVGKA